ncbi:MAG: tandem-95 repeat protein [Rhodospirillaceae bacterium]
MSVSSSILAQPDATFHAGRDLIGTPSGPTLVLDGSVLVEGLFFRDGDTLIIQGPDGRRIVIEEYFATDPPPDLETFAGATMPGAVVSALADAGNILVAQAAGDPFAPLFGATPDTPGATNQPDNSPDSPPANDPGTDPGTAPPDFVGALSQGRVADVLTASSDFAATRAAELGLDGQAGQAAAERFQSLLMGALNRGVAPDQAVALAQTGLENSLSQSQAEFQALQNAGPEAQILSGFATGQTDALTGTTSGNQGGPQGDEATLRDVARSIDRGESLNTALDQAVTRQTARQEAEAEGSLLGGLSNPNSASQTANQATSGNGAVGSAGQDAFGQALAQGADVGTAAQRGGQANTLNQQQQSAAESAANSSPTARLLNGMSDGSITPQQLQTLAGNTAADEGVRTFLNTMTNAMNNGASPNQALQIGQTFQTITNLANQAGANTPALLRSIASGENLQQTLDAALPEGTSETVRSVFGRALGTALANEELPAAAIQQAAGAASQSSQEQQAQQNTNPVLAAVATGAQDGEAVGGDEAFNQALGQTLNEGGSAEAATANAQTAQTVSEAEAQAQQGQDTGPTEVAQTPPGETQPGETQPGDGTPADGTGTDGTGADGTPADPADGSQDPDQGQPADQQVADAGTTGDQGDGTDQGPQDAGPTDPTTTAQDPDAQPTDGPGPDGTPPDGTPVDGTPVDGTQADGQPTDGAPPDGQPTDGTPVENQPVENQNENPPPDSGTETQIAALDQGDQQDPQPPTATNSEPADSGTPNTGTGGAGTGSGTDPSPTGSTVTEPIATEPTATEPTAGTTPIGGGTQLDPEPLPQTTNPTDSGTGDTGGTGGGTGGSGGTIGSALSFNDLLNPSIGSGFGGSGGLVSTPSTSSGTGQTDGTGDPTDTSGPTLPLAPTQPIQLPQGPDTGDDDPTDLTPTPTTTTPTETGTTGTAETGGEEGGTTTPTTTTTTTTTGSSTDSTGTTTTTPTTTTTTSTIGPVTTVLSADSLTTTEDTVSVSGNVLANDVGTSLTVISVTGFLAGNPTTVAAGVAVEGDLGGQFVIASDGDVTFQPLGQFEIFAVGEAPTTSVTYTVQDSSGATSSKTVTATVNGANDAPLVSGIAQLPISTTSSASVTRQITILDAEILDATTDVDFSDTLSVTSFSLSAGSAAAGAVAFNGGGTWTFTPAADVVGTVTFEFVASDGRATASGTTEMVLQAAPILAVADSINTIEDTTNVLGNLLTNDTGDGLTITNFSDTQGINGMLGAGGLAGTNGGLLSVNADGSYDFDQNGEFNSLANGVTGTTKWDYTAQDDFGNTVTETLTVEITGVNDAPTNSAGAGGVGTIAKRTATNNTSQTITQTDLVTGTATDVDTGDSLTAINLALDVGSATNGSLVDNNNGTWTFTPNLGYTGTVNFTYDIQDAIGATTAFAETASVTVSNTPVTVNAGSFDTSKLLTSNATQQMSSFTIEFWFKPGAVQLQTILFLEDTGNNASITVTQGVSGEISIRAAQGLSATTEQTATLFTDVNTWRHFAASYDGGSNTFTLYEDGIAAIGTTTTTNVDPNFDVLNPSLTMYVGGSSGGGQYDGQLADIRVWDAALNGVDINGRYNTTLAGTETNLRAYLDFSEGTANSFADDATTGDIASYAVNSGDLTVATAGPSLTPVDPLVIDLDGDGVELLGTEAGVGFDMDMDGAPEITGWSSPDDGILVFDQNGDGLITSIEELISPAFDLGGRNTQNNLTSIEVLALYDDNGDGKISDQDALYAGLQIWQDANSDGRTDDGELLDLEDLGITAFVLPDAQDPPAERSVHETGNTTAAEGIVETEDGGTMAWTEVFFDQANDDEGYTSTGGTDADGAATTDINS